MTIDHGLDVAAVDHVQVSVRCARGDSATLSFPGETLGSATWEVTVNGQTSRVYWHATYY